MFTILVVDDNPEVRVLLGRMLRAEGYAVIEAADGQEVLPAVRENAPDLILLDIALPKKNGLDVLSDLKSRPETKDIPVIIVSVNGNPEDLDEARRRGAFDYVNKPWAPGEVELRVQWAMTAVGMSSDADGPGPMPMAS